MPLILPHTALFPLGSSEGTSTQLSRTLASPSALSTVASLLYFETVTLVPFGASDSLGLPAPAEVTSRSEDAVRRWGESGLKMTELWAHPDYTLQEVVDINYVLYVALRESFKHAFNSFFSEGVLLEQPVEGYWNSEERTIPVAGTDRLSLPEVIEIANREPRVLAFDGQGKFGETGAEVLRASVTANPPMSLYLLEMFRETNPELRDSVSQEVKLKHLVRSTQLVTFVCAISTPLTDSVVTDSERYLSAHSYIRSRNFDLVEEPSLDNSRSVDITASEVLREALVELPLAMPRSPEALMRLRELLGPELKDLRHALRDIARDLHYEQRGAPSRGAIVYKADQRLLRPLRNLRRRLAHPSREMLRNLFTAEGFLSSTVGLGVALLGLVPPPAATVLGGAIPLLAAALKTRRERRAEIDRVEGLAFLLKLPRQI